MGPKMGPKSAPKKVLKNWGVSRLQSVFKDFFKLKIKGVKIAFKRPGEGTGAAQERPSEGQEWPGRGP